MAHRGQINGRSGDHGTPTSQLERVRAAEREIEQLEEKRRQLRTDALRLLDLGEAGPDADIGVGTAKNSWYPLVALGILAAIFQLPLWALYVRTPEISAVIGVPRSGVASVVTIAPLMLIGMVFGVVALTHWRTRRVHVVIGGGSLALLGALMAMTASSTWALWFAGMAFAGAGSTAGALHRPLLMDLFSPSRRPAVLAWYRGLQTTGVTIAAAVVLLTTSVFDLTWRSTFLVIGVLSAIGLSVATRLSDPGHDAQDSACLHDLVADDADVDPNTIATIGSASSISETFRRALTIPSLRGLLGGYAVMGAMALPLQCFLFMFLGERWRMTVEARGVFFSLVLLPSLATVYLFGRDGRRIARAAPTRFVLIAAIGVLGGAVCMAIAILMPAFALMAILVAIALCCLVVVVPSLDVVTMSLVDSEARSHVAALSEAAAAVGAIFGTALLASIDQRFGFAPAFVLLLVPAVMASRALFDVSRAAQTDIEARVDRAIEAEEISLARSRGKHLPLLSCHHVDFSYGQLQVLFDVEFTVDDGQIVALLGTNGAGKSTLLNVISGLCIPQRGVVRTDGVDITHFAAERRVRLGITQIPGGKSVFGPLSVAENLRLYGYTLGRTRARTDRAVDQVFEAFPTLDRRRNQLASTLSGGEQQMLGLGRALMLEPRILLIDELSLGLAPVIVGELLGIVQKIREGGTAVVLVEQSVNVALTVADHAYFMEKGSVRFDGPAADLLARRDLLRSVFLEGAANALAPQVAATVTQD